MRDTVLRHLQQPIRTTTTVRGTNKNVEKIHGKQDACDQVMSGVTGEDQDDLVE